MSDSDKITRWRYQLPDGEIIGVVKRGKFYNKRYRICNFDGINPSNQFLPEDSDTVFMFETEDEAQCWLDDYADNHGYRVIISTKGRKKQNATR